MPNRDQTDIVGMASTYSAGTRIAPHAHTAHQLVHAISGTMRVAAQNMTWFVPPGRVLWVPAHVVHGIRCIGRVEMRTAYLSEACPVKRPLAFVMSATALMRETLVRLGEDNDTNLAPHLAAILLAEMKRSRLEPNGIPIPRDPRLVTLTEHFQNAPADPLTLSLWAERLGFSERNLIRHIRAETGMTFRELRRLSRIMVAIDMLSAGQSVTATAFDVGFETPSAFIHAFQLLMGKTPRQFVASG